MDIHDTEDGDQIVALEKFPTEALLMGRKIAVEIPRYQILAVKTVQGEKPGISITANYLAAEIGNRSVSVTICGKEKLAKFDRLRCRQAIF